MTKDGHAKRRAPFVVPAFDGRPVFVEIKTGKVHDRACVVFVGVAVTPDEVLSKLPQRPTNKPEALRQLYSFVEQLSQFTLGNVLTIDRVEDGLPVLRKVAERPLRASGSKLPG